MKKEDFKPHTRYTVTWRDTHGKLRPANLYVYRLYDDFLVARLTQNDGLLRKFSYDEIVKIVKATPVREADRFVLPDALLKEKVWATRTKMEQYATSPHIGK